MGNPQPLRDSGGDHLPEGLLLEGRAARLDEAAFAVQDGPPFAKVAVTGPVRGAEVDAAGLVKLAQQGVAHIRGKAVLKEVYVLPGEGAALGFQPVVVGEAQTQVGIQEPGRVGKTQGKESRNQPVPCAGDRAVRPPLVEGGTVYSALSYANAHGQVVAVVEGRDLSNGVCGGVKVQFRHGKVLVQ